MSRSLVKKLKFVVVVLALLAMMIPTAIPVSAAYADLTMYLVNPITGDTTELDGGYNILGAGVYVTSDIDVTWGIAATPGSYCDVIDADNRSIMVNNGDGEVSITATDADNHTANVNKKWDIIDYTEFDVDAGSATVTWNQSAGCFFASGTITDTVIGATYGNPLQGAILNWYLLDSTAVVPMTALESEDLKDVMEALVATHGAYFVQFLDDDSVATDPGTWGGIQLTEENGLATVTDVEGSCTVSFGAWGEEAVKIVVVPEYPNDPQLTVVPEVATFNFDTEEYEVVPQVRWVGEKIVLEKNFSSEFAGAYVNFVITSGEGALETIIDTEYSDNGESVWTQVAPNGIASVILTSDAANQVNVRASLYAGGEIDHMVAQQAFTVYFLKFEGLHLSDVVGKRTEHNAGTWMDPVNPYNQCFPYWADDSDFEDPYNGTYDADLIDVTEQDRNVSQDALERAQVKGWFMGVNMSTRPEGLLDVNGDDDPDITLPAYRWVLPDDWDKLGAVASQRIHWDIMDAPNDTIVSEYELGPYVEDSVITRSGAPLIGPFTPGIEVMTPAGWDYNVNSDDLYRQYVTVVEDDLINEWDAPMPPAKIIFKINEGNGYFKEAFKGDIYIDAGMYTNPFYYAMIPAHWAIPATAGNEGGYDWNSFVSTYGPYRFWETINQYASDVPTTDVALYPTAMEVYSDNHGEAMVWLNGDWNLDLDSYNLIGGKDGVDAMDGEEVGVTYVQATADYPYFRIENAVMSNIVTKTWYWNGMILGIDNHTYANYSGLDDAYSDRETEASLNILSAGDYTCTYGNENPDVPYNDALEPNGRGISNDKMVFVWARDRDGLAEGMLGARLDINGITGGPFILQTVAERAISQYNWVTKNIFVEESGFLAGTNGVRTSDTTGYCYFRTPTDYEKVIFEKNWGTTVDATGEVLDADDFVVAGFDLYYAETAISTVQIIISSTDLGYTGQPIGMVDYTINVHFGGDSEEDMYVYPLDDPILAGDANLDGVIDVQDIVAIENMIMEVESSDVNGDATSDGSINMGDVVKVIRMIYNLD